MDILPTAATGDYRIDALLGPQRWATGTITYGFPGTDSAWPDAAGEYGPGGSSEPFDGFAALSAPEADAVTAALAAWAAVADLDFARVADDAGTRGTLRFAWTSLADSLQAQSYLPGALGKAGDVWLNTQAPWYGFTPGTYDYSTLLHEIGHALGLTMPSDGLAPLPASEDAYATTVMSGNASAGSSGSWAEFEPTTPMLYDILAIQALYGANASHRTGDDVYTFAQGSNYLETIWDAGGEDTVVWQADSQAATIDLREGRFSTLGNALTYWSADLSSSWTDPNTVALAYGTTIENATGGGAGDTLIGNGANNRLQGRGGNDSIDGGAGTDTAAWTQAAASYRLSLAANGPTVQDVVGSDGTDALASVERLEFADKTIVVEQGTPKQPYDGLPVGLYNFFIVAFDAAPGVTYLDQLAEAWWYFEPIYRDQALREIVEIFTTKPQFTDVYPLSLSDHDLAVELVSRIVKGSATQAAKLEAVTDIEGALGAGWTRGRVIYQVFGNLASKPYEDPTWGGTAKQFANQIEVAKVYSEGLLQDTTDLETLRSVLAPVTPTTDVSSETKIVELIGQALLDGPGV